MARGRELLHDEVVGMAAGVPQVQPRSELVLLRLVENGGVLA